MPQHAKRIKIRRKDLRQPDEFETLTGQVAAWADANRTLVVSVVAGLLAIALVVVLVNRSRTARNERAASDFQTVYADFQAAKYAEAATAFGDLAGRYPSAPFGRLALLYRAHALARQDDPAAAATAYEEYLAVQPEATFLRQEALAGLARAKEAAGDTAAALESYTQAGALEGPFRTGSLLGAARMQEAAGHADQAREIYSRLLNESPDNDLKTLLLAKLPPGSDKPAAGAAAEGAAVEPEAGVR